MSALPQPNPSRGDLIVTALGGLLRGDLQRAVWLESQDLSHVLLAAREHAVVPLVTECLAAHSDLAPRLWAVLSAEAQGHAAADLIRERELRVVIAELHVARVDILVIKGAALAYTHYRRPDLRPRADSDVLIASASRSRAEQTLVRLGYRPAGQVSGALVTHQAIYEKVHHGVVIHSVDLHWRIANPEVFADVLTFEELHAVARPIAALSPKARGLSDLHALLLACVHRVAHHYDDEHLVWLYDIHLIASQLGAGGWSRFVDLAHERGVLTICRQGLDKAAAHFETVVPASVRDDPRWADAAGREMSAQFLKRDRTQLHTLLSNLRALPSWTDRATLVREHLFPPVGYMREVYAPSSRAPLGVLYVGRAVRGAWRWLGRA